jgi:hypothetical protein
MDGMELRILFNSCLQGRKGNNRLLMPLKSSILFKVSSAQQSKIRSGRVSVPRNDRYRMMTLPNLHVFSSCYKSYNPFPLPESPLGVSHAVREINRGAELLEEVSSSLLDQSTEEAADIEDGEIESNHERGDVEGITKGLLEWPKICTQVAQFACTPMGILVARDLPIGASVDESEELQAQTEAARSLSTPLNFSGIEDLRGIVAGAISGNVCTVTQLCAVKKTLSSARRLHDQVQQGRVLFV